MYPTRFSTLFLCLLLVSFPAFAGPIGGGGGGEAGATSVTGTANQVTASPTTGAVILSTPQNLHTAATPTFGGLTLTPGPITITQGTITADAQALSSTATWNNVAVTFTGLKTNITNTASAAGSLLMDLQVGGGTALNITRTGIATSSRFVADTRIAAGSGVGILGVMNANGVYEFIAGSGLGGVDIGASFAGSGVLGWDASTNAGNGTQDLKLLRDAANTLAQRNGINPQISRGYGTFTDTANYERWSLSATTGTGITLAAETAGTGGDNLGITLTPAGTGNVTVSANSFITPAVTVGASGTSITQMRVYTPTLDPASVAVASTAEQTYTVTGLTTADKVIVNKPTMTAGCVIGNARVSLADTLAITWGNVQAVTACDPASEVYAIIAIRS